MAVLVKKNRMFRDNFKIATLLFPAGRKRGYFVELLKVTPLTLEDLPKTALHVLDFKLSDIAKLKL